MRYKLYENSLNDTNKALSTVMINRGLSNPNEYIRLDDSCLIDFKLLDNIEEAVSSFLYHMENGRAIHIIVDCDVDGYTSASMIYQYIKKLNNQASVTYSLHTGKKHGLSDDITIPENIDLLIIPDAGTNDVEQCYDLRKKNMDIIILDHHIQDKINPYAIVVNNQPSSRYDNKDLCGAGIVYKFLKAVDEEFWGDEAETYLDLVSLANIADCMDIKSYETKRLIDKGLYNIQNKFLQAVIEKQSYSIGSKLTVNGVQFFIAPLMNALIRVGTQAEKDLLFKALAQEDTIFEYETKATKNKPSETIQETIYKRVVRLCVNAREKQGRLVEKHLDKLCQYIEKHNMNKNRVMFVPVDDIVGKNLTGIAAMKIAEKYNRPCLLLRKKSDSEAILAGSGRNVDISPIDSLKDLLMETDMFKMVAGHDNAFGVEIELSNIPPAIKKLDSALSKISFEPCYLVDFEVDYSDISVGLVYDISSLLPYYGQGLEESRLCIKNITIDKSQISLIGKNSDTVSFLSDDEVVFIKFKCSTTEPLMEVLNESWTDSGELTLNIVGRANINTYGNKKTPQIIIDDYELVGRK